MGYPEQFQAYREGRGLTREQLATRADCHRNTVMNVESGRPVRFATIVHLMRHLGYSKESLEVKALALQWLEAVTGVCIGLTESKAGTSSARKSRTARIPSARVGLTQTDVELLGYAARNRKVLNTLRAIRDLIENPAPGRAG